MYVSAVEPGFLVTILSVIVLRWFFVFALVETERRYHPGMLHIVVATLSKHVVQVVFLVSIVLKELPNTASNAVICALPPVHACNTHYPLSGTAVAY